SKGLILATYGVVVIGLVDNVLRPLLVGKDTKMPDYVVLISTLGGMAVFGLTGFVLGPAIAALFMATWDIFANMQQQEELQLQQSLRSSEPVELPSETAPDAAANTPPAKDADKQGN
ncbi:MAG: AI-2E family transporter, partial [Comamonas sp.]